MIRAAGAMVARCSPMRASKGCRFESCVARIPFCSLMPPSHSLGGQPSFLHCDARNGRGGGDWLETMGMGTMHRPQQKAVALLESEGACSHSSASSNDVASVAVVKAHKRLLALVRGHITGTRDKDFTTTEDEENRVERSSISFDPSLSLSSLSLPSVCPRDSPPTRHVIAHEQSSGILHK